MWWIYADKINIPYWKHVITVIGKQETFQKLQRQEIRKVIQTAYPKEACIWVQEFFLGELLKPEEEADGSNENTSQSEGNDANTINAQKYLVNKGQREVKHNNLDNHDKSNVNECGTKDTLVGPATHQKKILVNEGQAKDINVGECNHRVDTPLHSKANSDDQGKKRDTSYTAGEQKETTLLNSMRNNELTQDFGIASERNLR